MEKETLEEGWERIYESMDYVEFDFPSFKLGAEWQAERMYSEEDIKQFGLYLGNNLKRLKGKTIDEIFEQFKKK